MIQNSALETEEVTEAVSVEAEAAAAVDVCEGAAEVAGAIFSASDTESEVMPSMITHELNLID